MANHGPLSTILSDAVRLALAAVPAWLGSLVLTQVPFWKLWAFALGVSLFDSAVRVAVYEFNGGKERERKG